MTTAKTIDIDIYGVVTNGKSWWDDDTGASNVIDQLRNLDETQDIVLHINSVGGEVSAGVSIYNRLRALRNKKSVIIEGLAASIASVIAMAGDEIHMALGSEMMIHNPSSYAFGEADDFEKAAESLRKTKESLIDIYEQRTGLSRDELATMMDNETWLTAKEAKEKGFCTSVDESLQMVACRKGTNLIVNGLAFAQDEVRGLPIDIYQEEKGDIMTVEELREHHTDVYNAIFNKGVEAERERIKALDGINNSARAEVVNKAKYETFATVNDVAVELLNLEPVADEPAVPTNQLQAIITDALQSSNTIDAVPITTPVELTEDDKALQLVNRVMDRMAQYKR